MKVSFDNVHFYEVKLKVDVDKGWEERGGRTSGTQARLLHLGGEVRGVGRGDGRGAGRRDARGVGRVFSYNYTNNNIWWDVF